VTRRSPRSDGRRRFLGRAALIAAGACAAGLPGLVRARASGARVVVVGGGFAGATCAKYLRRADPTLKLTLVEREPRYVTAPFSNLVLAGARTLGDLTLGYEQLARHHGIELVHGEAAAIDAAGRRITLQDGRVLDYDRAVVAPGIDFDAAALPGYDGQAAAAMPHAWIAGAQTDLLRRQLEAVSDGGTVLITVPRAPIRCPPGPFERASLIAHYLKPRRSRCKILILDANESFPDQELFLQGWQALYPGMIEWVPGSKGGEIVRVDAAARKVHTAAGSHTADVVNVIPPQKAGGIAGASALAGPTGWCPIDGRTFESTLQPNMHVIGDAAIAGKLPKSAAAANSEAKVCALAVAQMLSGEPVGDPSFVNACYSLLTPDYGISIAGVYGLTAEGIAPLPDAIGTSPLDAPAKYRQKEARDAEGWYQNIVADSFT
jgi:sulfide dehydrogenase [flavocytochrome c] flavoprotein subunit